METGQAERPLQKVKQVAQRLNISRAYVYQLMERGQLPFVKLGSARRVPADAVERLAREGTIETTK